MGWKKLGLVGVPDHSQAEQASHCQLPVADVIDRDVVRVYYAGRTQEQVSHISTMDIRINGTVVEILGRSTRPVLFPGSIGTFDQYGVYPSCIVNELGKKYLFYIGWIKGFEQPLFYAQIGLAISSDGGATFKKNSVIPIMSTSQYDPCLVTSPHIIKDGQELFRMTYVSGIKWERDKLSGKLKSFYNIKIAESTDLINWKRMGITAIDFRTDESNIARSFVLKESGVYKMWYSFVNPKFGKYRIGYAESKDFANWKRLDEKADIDVGKTNDFDSQMICYPCIFDLHGQRYMLYNGNNFGENGFGLAFYE